MALLTWNDRYSVRIRTFDAQHKQLFDCLNELHDAMKRGLANSAVQSILMRLVGYTRSHFAAEEEAMARLAYPDYEPHQQVHRLLTARVNEFVERFRRGELTLSISLMEFLRDWLEQHIVGMDQQYSEYMNARGVK